MKYNKKPVAGYIFALLFAGMAISCSKDNIDNFVPEATVRKISDQNIRSRAVAGVVGDTLTVIDYGDGSFVGFYEFSPGEVAIRQSAIAAPKPGQQNARVAASLQISAKLDRLSEQNQSLVEIYKAIAPAPQEATIKRLAEAQIRLTKAKSADQSTPIDLGELPPPDRPADASARSAAGGCSVDYYNDNYGAQWFIDNYINENRFRKAMTNEQYARIRTVNDSYTKVAAMAPDFATGIRFSGERFLPCPIFGIGGGCRWESRWSFDIAPRGVEVWNIYSSKVYSSTAAGYDPCRRVHLGVCNDTPDIQAWNF
ncbi:hypothetical protein BN8_01688 [Fibrisoma limi BUZ 3]|uniref:Uncharacterized protein n=1 Tax=Fibrisoma limi BUZ 3 TaxID=1185876 RepID=I2GFJ7_9BACT|nr:hypothetical protein [Fibrisoma limi]CCH52672.1 hypothetical protein BN8_01688 [Fibrisoma limi BUZ 3]